MNGNILIVDDEASALKLLRDILAAEGYQTRPFTSGEMALRSTMAEPPELILLDVRMPGMDGFELCRRIKEDGASAKETPVIFISGATDTEDKLRAFRAGGVDYITKPFQREEVIARVRTHVALHRSRQALMQAEVALRKSEQGLKIAQAVAHLGHWEMNMHSGELMWSDETYQIFGLDPRAALPSYDALLNTVHPEDRARFSDCVERARRGADFNIEYRVILPDGRTRIVHSKGVLVTFPDADRHPEVIGTVQCVTGMIGVIQDITEHKELEWRLEYEARTDVLTGCATRRYFLELAHQELARIRRYGGDLSVLMLDLDHFKIVNDAHGHQVGDLTLRKLAQVCHPILRQEDVMGRLGGEEFAILLIATGSQRAFEVAERLREAVAAAEVPLERAFPLRFTTSIGVATMEESDTTVDAILKRADDALYKAKDAGRNRVA
jgi:diguanylate cyclase (GGDEF)-like protein